MYIPTGTHVQVYDDADEEAVILELSDDRCLPPPTPRHWLLYVT